MFFFQDYVGKTYTIRSKIPVSYVGFLNWNLVMFAHDGYITEIMAKLVKLYSRVVEKFATTGHAGYSVCSNEIIKSIEQKLVLFLRFSDASG